MKACSCSLPQCKIHGCINQPGLRMYQETAQIAAPISIYAQGCICPPTSEQTCRADYCPRKSFADRHYGKAKAPGL